MFQKANVDIRCCMIEKGVNLKEVAAVMQIFPSSLSRALANDDMRPSRKRAILEAIDKAAEKKGKA